MRLILASNSPRRKDILTKLGLTFEVIPSAYEEKLESSTFSYEQIEDLAFKKCIDVVKNVGNNNIVLAADTVVVFNNEILGKPKDRDDAFNMLNNLQGKTHKVVTSICAINTKDNLKYILSSTSYVAFKPWTSKMIAFYIDNFKPFDKAGSYGIQELPPGYLDRYEGSFDNIVGLCPDAVKNVLKQVKY